MAVILTGPAQRYLGLSDDVKPTTCAVGATIFTTDDGASYVWDSSDWVRAFPTVDGTISGGLTVLDIVHNEIHRAKHFTATHAETLASGSASVILLESPGSATATIHFIASISTSAGGTLIFSRIPNATVGTAVYANNNNLTIAGSSELSVTHNGAVTTAGSVLENGALGGVGPSFRVGGTEGLRNEWMLNHSSRYLLQFTSSAATNVAWKLMWYENI